MRISAQAALVAVAGTVMTFASPMSPAIAAGTTLTGGCGFVAAASDALNPNQYTGVIYVAAFSENSPLPTPNNATVKCWIEVNGQPVTAPLTTNGTGLILNAQRIDYRAVEGDTVTECEQVTAVPPWVGPDGTNPDCPAATEITAPPPVVTDVLDEIDVTTVDPTVCPIFMTLGQLTGGGIPGVFQIGPDGDLTVAGNPSYDCPPYWPGGGSTVPGTHVQFLIP